MQPPKNVLVLGGTGHLGRDVVHLLRQAGVSTRIASRRSPGIGTDEGVQWIQADLLTGKGVAESVQGAHAILFCAGAPKNHVALEVDGLDRLLAAARKASVSHFVFVSIVGIEHLPVPYYRTKLAAEELIRRSGVPYSILRAAQFHYFVDRILSSLSRVPFVLPVPRDFSVQPVATEDVALRLARCLVDGPRGLLKDFCGPEIFSMAEAAALWKTARGIRKPIVQFPVPGKIGAAFRQGHNTNRDAELGLIRWSDWLDREYHGSMSHTTRGSEALTLHGASADPRQ